MQWDVSIADNILWGQLKLSASFCQTTVAWSVLSALSFSILSAACVHQSNSGAGLIGQSFHFPRKQPSTNSTAEDVRTLIPVGRVFERQLHALQELHYRVHDRHHLIVIHNQGCLECALKLCFGVQGRVVIS